MIQSNLPLFPLYSKPQLPFFHVISLFATLPLNYHISSQSHHMLGGQNEFKRMPLAYLALM